MPEQTAREAFLATNVILLDEGEFENEQQAARYDALSDDERAEVDRDIAAGTLVWLPPTGPAVDAVWAAFDTLRAALEKVDEDDRFDVAAEVAAEAKALRDAID